MKPICIIDDDEDIRAVMTFALEFEGIKVISLNSAEEAIEHLSGLSPAELPSLIVLDYMMQDMDGLEFIHHVRKFYPNTIAKIPLVLSTARIDLDTGIPSDVRILSKPIDLMDFLNLAKAYWPLSAELSLS